MRWCGTLLRELWARFTNYGGAEAWERINAQVAAVDRMELDLHRQRRWAWGRAAGRRKTED